MKKTPKELSKNSLEMRNLNRFKMPPPTTSFVDRKKKSNKKACRNKKP